MTESDPPDDQGPTVDPDGSVRAIYDWSSTAPSTAVIETVAVATDRDPITIEPLYETVDPDALDTIVRSNGTRPSEGDPIVTFAFAGRGVTVHCDGSVVVRPAEERSDSE